MKVKLRAEGIEYVIEQSLHEFAWIETVDSAPDEKACVVSITENSSTEKEERSSNGDTSKESDGIDQITSDIARLSGSFDVEKKEAYERADVLATAMILRYLGEEDRAFAITRKSAFELWAALKNKYSQPCYATASKYQEKMMMFTFKESHGIEANWSRLKQYRRRAENNNAALKDAFKDNFLYNIFQNSLPDVYENLLDVFMCHESFTVPEKINFLYQKECRLKLHQNESRSAIRDDSNDDEEAENLARDGGQYGDRGNGRGGGQKDVHYNQSRRRRQSSASHDSTASQLICCLCESTRRPHDVVDCPYLEIVQELLAEYKKKEANKRASKKSNSKPSSRSKATF